MRRTEVKGEEVGKKPERRRTEGQNTLLVSPGKDKGQIDRRIMGKRLSKNDH